MADQLVVRTYQISRHFPDHERFGLTAQLRRAAVSVAANIVEGSARDSEREYVHFLNIAAGSAAEAQYLVDLSGRIGVMRDSDAQRLASEYTRLSARLHALTRALRRGRALRTSRRTPEASAEGEP